MHISDFFSRSGENFVQTIDVSLENLGITAMPHCRCL